MMSIQITIPRELAANYDFRVVKVQHSKIADFIALSWGTRECIEYIERLATDTRGHSRAGFDHHVMHSIMALHREHQRLYPFVEGRPAHGHRTDWSILKR